LARPYLEKPITKKGCGVTQGEGPEFKPQYQKEKEREKRKQLPHLFSELTRACTSLIQRHKFVCFFFQKDTNLKMNPPSRKEGRKEGGREERRKGEKEEGREEEKGR
jgi:hypothetical protein